MRLREGEDLAQALERKKSGLHWHRLPLLTPRPQTVIDVGAAAGMKSFYRAFPASHLYLIDALEENRAALEAHRREFDCTVIISGVGAEAGTLRLNVPVTGRTGKTSFMERAGAFADEEMIPRDVEVRRLDDLIPELAGSVGLKIDAEGFETRILDGAPRILKQCSWVVCEVSMAPRFVGDPLFAGIYPIMDAAGFVFRDLVDLTRQGGGDLRRIDAVFVRQEFIDYPRECRQARIEARAKAKAAGRVKDAVS